MKSVHFFYRHPHSIYFSIEKLFHRIADNIRQRDAQHFHVEELLLPFSSKLSSIYKNISFVKNKQGDVNHITGDVHYGILGCSKKNINILTVHDCVLLHHYKTYDLRHWIIRWLWYKLPVRHADAVTVISENTKSDLLNFTNSSADKIKVIPNFIDPAFKPVAHNFNEHSTKLLFIGTAPNKNLERVVDAIQQLDVELVIIGYLNGRQLNNLKSKKIKYSLLNKVSDQQILDIYAGADIMLFPSTYEGFGLPIIEAQAVGRPVITSLVEPMPSVAGDGACLVDPFNTDSIRAGIKKIIQDKSYREKLIMQGFENVKRFQLEKVTSQYLDLYQNLIAQKKN